MDVVLVVAISVVNLALLRGAIARSDRLLIAACLVALIAAGVWAVNR